MKNIFGTLFLFFLHNGTMVVELSLNSRNGYIIFNSGFACPHILILNYKA